MAGCITLIPLSIRKGERTRNSFRGILRRYALPLEVQEKKQIQHFLSISWDGYAKRIISTLKPDSNLEPPSEVQNCTSAEETETSFKVFCNASLDDSNGLEEHFYVEVRDSETGELLQNYSLNFPEVAVRGLDPGIWYRVSVYVTNEAGRSKPYIIEIRTIPKPETTNVPGTAWIIEVSSLIFIVSAVVGGLLLVLVMLLLCSQISLGKEEKVKRYFSNMLSGPRNLTVLQFSIRIRDICDKEKNKGRNAH
ncbi:fibronectin type-III domain-containing protein [Caerostris extrusa]|uniref:Fibronectin type-III domain-containing protein n=1 Tax=Caerostris extrusa TaxID=172846 RepID=A0AAV4XZD3_CAEEX|nr:fibronectin type-III domain-containing protein [Caerostris extrusa]